MIKRQLSLLLAVLLVFSCLPMTVLAAGDDSDFVITNGVLTAYTGDAVEVVIPTGVTAIGDGDEPVFGYSNSDITSVVIPDTVTTINAYAFYTANGIEELTIPEGVTTIKARAFAAMSKLETVYLPSTLQDVGSQFGLLFAMQATAAPTSLVNVHVTDGGSTYSSYDGAVYSANGKTLVYCSPNKTSIEWNSSVEAIGSYAFSKSAMTNVEIPDSVTTIDSYAFYSSALTSVNIPSSVTSIGASAFYNSKLKSVTFAEGLQTIGNSAFGECYFAAGASIEIPASVQSIGSSAFDCLGDYGASSIKLLSGSTVLGSSFIPSYNSIIVYGASGSTAEAYVNSAQSSSSSCQLTFGLLESGGGAEVTGVSLPAELTLTAGETSQLTAAVLPENAADKSLVWRSGSPSVASVSDSGLVTALSEGQAVITAAAGNGVSGSCTVTVRAADNQSDFVIENGVLLSYTGSSASVTIPSTVTVIGDGTNAAFGSSVESVSIPTSVTEIAANAFNYCTGLKTVSFSGAGNLTKIGEKAFSTATSLQTLAIPEGVSEIGAQAFVATHSLQSISLPSTLTSFGNEGDWFGLMFVMNNTSGSAHSSLASVTVGAGNSLYSSYDGAVYSADGKTLLYCPAKKTGLEWNPAVESIGQYAFYKSDMQNVTLPDSLTRIESRAFSGAALTALEIPASVKTIGDSAFFNSKLTDLVLNEGLETIGNSAFSQSRITGVTIPASVVSIGSSAFDFEYGSGFNIRILGANTQLADGFIPYYYAIAVYGQRGSTAESYVAAKQESEGASCKLTFEALADFTEVTGITLDKTALTLRRQEQSQLTAALLPEGVQAAVAWSSSDSSVATVSSAGLVTAVQPGKATITATAGGYSADCAVEVVIADGESDFTVNAAGEITGYLGADWTTLTIPETVSNIAVTGIAGGAFANQKTIETVELPATVTSIGANAFASCSKLKAIDLSHVTSLGESAFYQCSALTSAALAEGLESVPASAFAGCLALTSVTLPPSLTEIGANAFTNCAFTELALPDGLTAIHAGALLGCPITTLHLPASLTYLGDTYIGDVFEEAGSTPANKAMTTITADENNPSFSAADGLLYNKDGTEIVFCPRGRTSAEVKSGVTRIGKYAFFMCFSLESVTLPTGLKTVGEQAFHYCEALTDCVLPAGLERVEHSAFFGCEEWTGVDNIPSSVQYIGPYGFTECKGSVITVPEGITEIAEYAFWGYESGLTKINLPSSLQTIGKSAFAWAKDVTELVIPEGVTSIGEEAFGRMDSLSKLTLPSTLVSIGEKAFLGGANISEPLQEIYIPASVTNIGADAFKDREALTIVADNANTAAARYAAANSIPLRLLDGGELDPDFEIVDGVLIAYHGTSSEIVIPSTVVEIGEGVFRQEEGEGVDLKKVTIPATVTKIDAYAFYGSELTEVVFEESSHLAEISESAFAYCTKLPSITLPDSLTVIGTRAFDGDSLLDGIAIPAGVESIGDYAFNICTGLRSVDFADQGSLRTIGAGAFYNCFRLTTLDIPEGVTSIGDQALRISSGLATVYLPSTLTSLGSSAPAVFADLSNATASGADTLTAIIVAQGNTVYSSQDGLLYTADGKTLLYCPSGLTGTVTVQDGTESIASNAFKRSAAEHVELPDSLTSIADKAFYGSKLTSAEIPGSVRSIGNSAFFYCSSLKTLQLNEGLETIAENAFSLTRVTGVTIPASVVSIGYNAFDFEYGAEYIRILGAQTQLADEFIPYYYTNTVYGYSGSTAETYVTEKQAGKGASCKLTFKTLDAFTPVTGITLDTSAVTLTQQETHQLTASVSPENATHTDVVYKSLDSGIATVDSTGLITACKPGTVIIRVLSSDGPYADCTVTVTANESLSDFTIDSRGYITAYTGSDAELVIPDTVNGVTVAGVAAEAFKGNMDIHTVSFPSTVQEIEASAFQNCKNLSSIEFSKNSSLKTIGAEAFENCSYLSSVVLPEGLEAMGASAFAICEKLESVTIPSTLKEIPEAAFQTCWRLTSLTLPEGVETVGVNAFYECEGLAELNLPNSLRTICEGAFAACVRLSEVTIPEGVATIKKQAFMSCTAMTSIHLPSTLVTLGSSYCGDVFENGASVLGCDHLETVTVAEGNPYFSSEDSLLYNADGTELLFCPRGRSSATVQDGTERIGEHAFFYCRKLTKVSLPGTLTEISDSAFSVCDALTEMTIPEGVTTIGSYAFSDCAALKTLNIPQTVTEIGAGAISSTGLETLVLPDSVNTLGDAALSYNAMLTSVTIPSSVTNIGENLFAGSTNLVVYTDSKNAAIYDYALDNSIPVQAADDGAGSSGSGGGSSSYTITVPSNIANGSVTASAKSARKNSTVTITVAPDSGYTLASLTVTDARGNSLALTQKSDSQYTFTMPASKVSIAVGFALKTATHDCPADQFTDVNTSLWYHEAIDYALENGLMSGTGMNTFAPNENLTRGMIAQVLYNREGQPAAGSGVFTDVADGQWYASAVNWAAANAIVSGYGDGTFGPNDPITREQMAAILYRYASYKGYSVSTSGSLAAFTDASAASAYAVPSLQWAVGAKLLSGKGGGILDPLSNATRAEVAQILMTFCESIAK